VSQYSELYYSCNRILAEIFTSDEVRRSLALPKRLVLLENVSRLVAARPTASYAERSRLRMAPVFLYNSAPESKIIRELKVKVC